jgi:phage-related protein
MPSSAYSAGFKKVIWMGSSKADLVAFPPDARRECGYQLEKVQRGESPTHWKPMSTIGDGVPEIRIRISAGAFRVVYFATQPAGVYVLHCFQKKTRKTKRQDLDLAAQRYGSVPRLQRASDEDKKARAQ